VKENYSRPIRIVPGSKGRSAGDLPGAPVFPVAADLPGLRILPVSADLFRVQIVRWPRVRYEFHNYESVERVARKSEFAVGLETRNSL
jgi:hypothetical protein